MCTSTVCVEAVQPANASDAISNIKLLTALIHFPSLGGQSRLSLNLTERRDYRLKLPSLSAILMIEYEWLLIIENYE